MATDDAPSHADPSDRVEVVDRGARVVARRTVVATDPATLFALVADPHRHHELDGSGTVQPTVSGPRRLTTGDRFTVAMRRGPVPYRITSTATDVVEDRVVEWRHPGRHSWRWELEPTGDGGTRVTESFDYRDSPLARVLEALKQPQNNARGIEETLRRVRERFG